VTVTHPFHPWHGRQLAVLYLRRNWGELHVTFVDEHQEIGYLPAAWTSAAPPDPFVQLADGRALFRIQDLTRLVTLLRGVQEVLQHDDTGDA
jgi:Family of unknown function (DUF5372)